MDSVGQITSTPSQGMVKRGFNPDTGYLDSITNRAVRKLGNIIQEMMGPMDERKRIDSSSAILDLLQVVATPIKIVESVIRLLGLLAIPMLLIKNTEIPYYKDSASHFYKREFVQIGLKELLDACGALIYAGAAIANIASYIKHSTSSQIQEGKPEIKAVVSSTDDSSMIPLGSDTPTSLALSSPTSVATSSEDDSASVESLLEGLHALHGQYLEETQSIRELLERGLKVDMPQNQSVVDALTAELKAQRESSERMMKMAMTTVLASFAKPTNITISAPVGAVMAAPMTIPETTTSAAASVTTTPARSQAPKPPQPPKPPAASGAKSEEGDLNQIKDTDSPFIAELKASLNRRNRSSATPAGSAADGKSAPATAPSAAPAAGGASA